VIPVARLKNVRLQLESLDVIIRSFLESLERNPELVEAIDNISGGNVRRALDLVKSFFGSGHVDTEKIVTIFEQDDHYYVPLHEFLRAVIFGDEEYYDPNRSPAANLFDTWTPDRKEHFLLPEMLEMLHAEARRDSEAGFVTPRRVYEHLQSCGFTPQQADSAVLRASRHSLVEASRRPDAEGGSEAEEPLRLTSLGAYHVQRLCHHQAYVDAMIVDTPIFDTATRQELVAAERIEQRLECTMRFLDYLDEAWSSHCSAGWLFDWQGVSRDVRTEVQEISARLLGRRHRGRRGRRR
jgi:hypothetical protein